MSLKLNYFDAAGRALPIRLALLYGGVQFEDKRYTFETWPAVKSSTPLGQVPYLEIDGTSYTQSTALLRYAAAKAGLSASATLEEKLVIDEICYILEDAFIAMPKTGETPDALVAARVAWQNGKLTTNLKRVEEYLKKSKSGYASPSGISIADLSLVGIVGTMASGFFDGIDTKFVAKNFPAIQNVVNTVVALDQFKAYFVAHPREAAYFF